MRTKNLLLRALREMNRAEIVEALEIEKEKFDEAFPYRDGEYDYYFAGEIKADSVNTLVVTEYALIEEIRRLREPGASKFPKP